MSDRSARAARRAHERAAVRSVLSSVGPNGPEDQRHRRTCAWPACAVLAPSVLIGDVHLALSPDHKRAFDLAWHDAARVRDEVA